MTTNSTGPLTDQVENDNGESAVSPSGATWRQLFDERATRPPIWSLNADELLPDQSGVWRYRELLSPIPQHAIVSRLEGNTGLYPVGIENGNPSHVGPRQIGSYAGLERFFLKHEGENPTGHSEDRGMTVGITMACLHGTKTVACISPPPNMAASLAAYAAYAGLRCVIFLPKERPKRTQLFEASFVQSQAYGARIVQVEGSFEEIQPLVEHICREQEIPLFHPLHPWCIEGQKTVGFEILQQLDWDAPDWLILPASSLEAICAVDKALCQAYQLSLISHIPRIAIIHVEDTEDRLQRMIEERNRVFETVCDEDIVAAKSVIDQAGIGCDIASAATVAGARKLVEQSIIQRDEQIVAILTGNLLNDICISMQQHEEILVKMDIEVLRESLSR